MRYKKAKSKRLGKDISGKWREKESMVTIYCYNNNNKIEMRYNS